MSTAIAKHLCPTGVNNRNILNGTSAAYSSALDLVERGFTILCINVDGARPTIIVHPDERIEKELKFGIHLIRPNGRGGRDEIYATEHKGCKVQYKRRSA